MIAQLIWSQTGGSGAPEITEDQPCSGGPSRELHNIIGVMGQSQISGLHPPSVCLEVMGPMMTGSPLTSRKCASACRFRRFCPQS